MSSTVSAETSNNFQRTSLGQSPAYFGQAIYQSSHALLIGNIDYKDPSWNDLPSVASELDEIQRALEPEFTVERVMNLDSVSLAKKLREFVVIHGHKDSARNRLLIYFAGHGYSNDDETQGYLVPVDAPNPNKDRAAFLSSAVPMQHVIAGARESKAKHILYLFDSCFSGTILQSRSSLDPKNINKSMVVESSRQFITAGAAGETVPSQSSFAKALTDALKYGDADLSKDGYITGTELGHYLRETIHKEQGGDQTPQFGRLRGTKYKRGEFILKVRPEAPPELLFQVTESEQPSLQGSEPVEVNTVTSTVTSVPLGSVRTQKTAETPEPTAPGLAPQEAVAAQTTEEVVEEKKGPNWLWILGGALLVGAAMSGGGSGGDKPPPTETGDLQLTFPKP